MERRKVNLRDKFEAFSEHWTPRIVAGINGQEVKLLKFKGALDWHDHENGDELFLVIKGSMLVHFRDESVEVKTGEMIVVPREVEHRPWAEHEVWVLIVDAVGTVNRVRHPLARVPARAEWL